MLSNLFTRAVLSARRFELFIVFVKFLVFANNTSQAEQTNCTKRRFT